MELSPSAHLDTFARDHLPPAEEWPSLDLEGAGLSYPQRLNCGQELLDATTERLGPDRPAVRGPSAYPDAPEIAWSYGELRAQVDRLAHALTEELGVQPGNRVLLRGPNTPELAACWLAVMKAGGIAVTVLAAQRPAELAEICHLARIRHAVCSADSLDGLRAAEVPGLHTAVFGSDGPTDLLRRAAHHPSRYAAVPTAADDIALLAYTSGTTGRPKGCAHFHRDVLAIADTFSARVLRPHADDLFTGSPPLGFTFGLGGLLIFPLRAGAATLLGRLPGPQGLLDAIAEHGVSVLCTAPTAYRGMLATLAETPYDLTSLRRCVSAGEHLPASTWHDWHERTGIRLIDGIGATEMLHIFVSAADDDIRPGTTGRPVPGFQARIVADDGVTPVPDGAPGLLAVRGPVGCRYLDDARQRAYVHGGWNLTGDTYVREPDGRLRYVARADDMIVSAGYNIPGPEVEEALLHHPDVREVAVVARPDERRGQVPVAHVVLTEGIPGDAETAAALREFVAETLVPYKVPREFVFATELPRTPTGKLQRFVLRERAYGDPQAHV